MKISKLLKIISALIAISVVIFLGAIASVAYTLIQSAPTIKVGSPSQNLTGGALEFLIPVSLDNRGVLPISELFMTGSVKTHYGTTLLDLKSSKLTLPPGGSGTLEVRLTVDLSKATPELMRVLLTEDQDLQVNVMFNGAVQPFLNVLVKANDTMKWGAPYKDLQIKEPTLSSHNATHLFIQVPISFKNNSTIFSVEGVSSIMVIDEEYRLVGYGWTHMDVKPKGEYSGTIDLYLESPWIGHPELLTQSLSKNYTVTISMPAPIVGEFKQTQTVSMEWGAPISDPQLGGFSASPHNSTHFRISVPLTFKDASPLPLTGKLSGAFYDAAGNRVGDVDQLWLEVQPGQTYVGIITGYVSNAAASQQSLNLLIVLDSPYGVYEKGLVINAEAP